MSTRQWLYISLGVAALVCATSVWAGDGVVALQTADPSCPNSSGNIYVNCNNGTVTDNRTGLVWLANANCVGNVDWYTAMEFVAGLKDISPGSDAAADDCGLSDGSSPGKWRLPSKGEWAAMVAVADGLGCIPTITNDNGAGCWTSGPGSSFSGVASEYYWSATTAGGGATGYVWGAVLLTGEISLRDITDPARVWPVRGGQ